MKTESKETKLLWEELETKNPREERIRELVAQGADLSGEFLKDIIRAFVPPSDTWEHRGKPIDLKYIQLLVNLGADVNYEDDEQDTGYNCLFEAAISWNVELTRILLKAGANPNSTSSETYESILSYVHGDQYYETHIMDRGGSEPLAEIEALIEEYGGKYFSELFTLKITKFLSICDNYISGLVTRKGNIRIENIPGIDKELIKAFNEWVENAPEKFEQFEYTRMRRVINPPDSNLLKWHNMRGLELAKQIKLLVGQNIKVEYCCINEEDIQKHQIVNAQTTIVELTTPIDMPSPFGNSLDELKN